MHEFVEDLHPLYAQATVVAVPLEVSAGTNIKVLEAMACAKPVVTTPAGCAGLELSDGQEALIRTGAADFADAICALLTDPERPAALGRQARETAERRFAWTKIADRAYEAYGQLVRTSRPR